MKILKIIVVVITLLPLSTKSQTFTGLPPGFNAPPWDLHYDHDDSILYTGGTFNYFANGVQCNMVARWNGIILDTLGSGVNDAGVVRDFAKFNDSIFVAGTFSKIGGLFCKGLAKWDGYSWHYFADFSDFGYGAVKVLYLYGGELYIGGNFKVLNGAPAFGLVKYDGSSFYTYPILDPGSPTISAICFYNGELYVGGNFQPGGGKNDIAKFDGTNWVSVGGGLSGGNTVVDELIVYNGELYVAGHFLTQYGDPGNLIAKWDGTNWSSVGTGLIGGNIYTMEIFNNELYVGGSLIDAGGIAVNNIAKWDGTSWHNIGANFSNGVTCLEAKDNITLFVGGGFVTVNGDTVNGICEYNVLTGLNEISNNLHVYISPNPASNFIDIKLSNGSINTIQIFDISGKLVLEKLERESISCHLDVSSFANGIYTIKVISNFGISAEKLIIHKLDK